MAQDSQLQALRRAKESEEQEVAQRLDIVNKVLEEREQAVAQTKKLISDIEERFRLLSHKAQHSAVRAQDGGAMRSTAAETKSLLKKREELQLNLLELEREQIKALERQALVQEEMGKIRLELRQIEKIKDERTAQELLASVAEEEIRHDEDSNLLKKVNN